MNNGESFVGFPEAGLRFLAELSANNRREWFNERKHIYKEQVEASAILFVTALGERLQSVHPRVAFDTRTNGAGSLLRIYRDTRFSKDKTPYNTHVRMVFWEGPSKKESHSGFFIGIGPGGVGLYVGTHGFDKPQLERYRMAVGDDALGSELERAIESIRSGGVYELGGSHYKRVPRGFDADHPRAELLKHNSLYAYAHELTTDHMSDPKLVDFVFKHCVALSPIHRWLVEVHSG